MKQFIAILALFFTVQFANAQTEDTVKMVKSGDMFEVTIYYDNGTIMQHGFLNAENKLDGHWTSYYEDGTKKCSATYRNGEKVGIWSYYYTDKILKVTYKNNKAVAKKELDSII